jgi:hypothetical protein
MTVWCDMGPVCADADVSGAGMISIVFLQLHGLLFLRWAVMMTCCSKMPLLTKDTSASLSRLITNGADGSKPDLVPARISACPVPLYVS